MIGEGRGAKPPGACDLVVVGLGIHGAVAALEATRRGLRVVALDRSDFGGATSWNSLRVLHGGLRYLQSGDLARYRGSVRSRSWFVRELPELVDAVGCLMPLYGEGVRRASLLGPALALDRALRRLWSSKSDRDLIPGGRLVPVDGVMSLFPAVRREGLRGGAEWFDGWMPVPQRVVIEILRRAAAGGCEVRNYTSAKHLLLAERDAVEGVAVQDERTGAAYEVRAPRVLNCAGPWAGDWIGDADDRLQRRLHRSIAFNLLFERSLPSRRSVAVTPPGGGRTYFLHPHGRRTLAGTYHACGSLAEGVPQRHMEAFLSDIRRAVPGFEVDDSDVSRVLPGDLPARQPGTDALVSRDIVSRAADADGPEGLVTLVGTKFTTAPVSAGRALAALDVRGRSRGPAPEIEVRRVPGVEDFRELASNAPGQARQLVEAMIEEEGVQTMDDLLLRRTDWGLAPSDAAETARAIGDLGLDLPL